MLHSNKERDNVAESRPGSNTGYTILRTFQDSSKTTLSIVLVMSHPIGSRTPRRDTYVGFCLQV